MKLDASDLRNAIRRLAAETKKAPREVCETAARGFIRDVVKITPPGSAGVSGSAAKKAGEAGIRIGLASIMVAAAKGFNGPFEDPADVHARTRNPRTGRTDKRILTGALRGSGKVSVDVATLRAFEKKLLALVGILSAGWNAAAEKLGVKLPAWVSRHGASRGSVVVKVDAYKFSITLNNEVKFVGNVKDYERRVSWAVKNQAKKMDRQCDFLLKKAIRAAGWL